jgi:hypothetical protein
VRSVITNGEAFYVPIPKCATNSLRLTFPDWRSTNEYRSEWDHLPGFALVRNPVDRWFSAAAEISKGHLPALSWDKLMNRARNGVFEVDAHTLPQSLYLEHYPNIDLVRLENAAVYIQNEYGRLLAWERRRDWEPVLDVIPLIEEYYADDLEIYARAS